MTDDPASDWTVPPNMTLAELEKIAIIQQLSIGGTRQDIAKRLGIGMRTLQLKIKAYEINDLAAATRYSKTVVPP